MTSVRLTRKLAQVIDGVDLKGVAVGDRVELSPHDAGILIAEGWAEPAGTPGSKSPDPRSVAAEHRDNATQRKP